MNFLNDSQTLIFKIILHILPVPRS